MRWLFAPLLRNQVALAAVASLLLNLAMLVPSLYTLQVFDRVFSSRSVETLLTLSALTMAALAFGYAMDVARARALAAAGRSLHEALSPAALEQALRQAALGGRRADADRLRDVAQLQRFLDGSGVRALFDAPWLPVYLLVIGLMHPLLALIAALGGGALALLAVVTDRITRTTTETVLRQSRDVGRLAESLVRDAETLLGLGMTANAVATWRKRHAQLLGEQGRLSAMSARLAALARATRQGVQIAVLGFGAWLVIGSGASPGIMVAATLLLGRALQPVEQLISGWKQLVDARGAWQRLCKPDALAAAETRMRLPAPTGRLALDQVVFVHELTRKALVKGVSLKIEPGESLGIVGPSGSGKTTLARLLVGIWHPQSGSVRLDDAELHHWDRSELGAHLGYLPQDVSLLDGSVAQNIARLGPVNDEAVVQAAQLAQAHDMILRLRDGYGTLVGEGGLGLSGGQRQRIALARALYGAPKVVVLDEPYAHLDAEGEAALAAALRALKANGTTVVVIGHRAGLMSQLDRIAVMQAGALLAIAPAGPMLAQLRASALHAVPALGKQGKQAAA